jgi:hypothetical protein
MIKLANLLKELYDENLIGSDYGEGSIHIVYNYGKDKVIKFNQNQGEPISDHIKIFDKYPDIFPKVYDIGEDYVILEKLDDNKAFREAHEINEILFYNNPSLDDDDKSHNPYIAELSKDRGRYIGLITTIIYNNLEDNQLKLELKKELPKNLYTSLINNWYPLLKKIHDLPWISNLPKDIYNHENFGYNSKGELKMLDI